MKRQMWWWVVATLTSCAVSRPPEPCAGVDCGEGRCVVDADVAVCLCEHGAKFDEGRCIATAPCDLVSCGNLAGSQCVVKDGRASCECPDARLPHEGSCVAPDPCLPNPCTVARRTTCELVGGGASCRCEPGYVPEGDGCSAVPLWTCNTQHTGNGQDSAEPDECPPLAATLARDTEVERTLLPAGDHDWFLILPWQREVTGFTAESDTLGLLVEVFDATGTRLLASDNRGRSRATAGYVSRDGAPLMVRVRALGDATGRYRAKYTSLGVDDFPELPEDAPVLTPSATINGASQYADDVDLVWLALPAQRAVRLGFHSTTARLDVRRDGVVVRTLRDGESISVTSAFEQQVLLSVHPESPDALGGFVIESVVGGADDHSEDRSFATVLTADGAWMTGVTQFTSDVDTFTFEQARRHAYRVRWQALSGATIATITAFERNGALIARSANSATQLSWLATSDGPAMLSLTNPSSNGAMSAYQLAVDDLGVDDHADDTTNATPVSFAQPVAGAATWPGDLDVFSFTPTAGHVIRVDALELAGEPGVVVSLQNAMGTLASGERTVTAAVTSTTPHFIVVQASLNGVSHYRLTVTDLGADDHGDTLATATPLLTDTWASGATQFATDTDCFKLQLVGGTVYRLNYAHQGNTKTVQVVQNGRQLVQTPLQGNDVRFSPGTSGEVEVRVRSTVLAPFDLRVETLGTDDFPNLTIDAALLPFGTTIDGAFEYGFDLDVFRFTVEANRVYQVDFSSGGGALGQLSLVTADGTPLGYDDSGPFAFALAGASEVFLAVRSVDNEVGTYQLAVTPLGFDDYGDTHATASTIAVGQTRTGAIDFGRDVDVFSFTGPPQRHLRARCTTPQVACELTLSKAGGPWLGNAGNPAELYFRAPASTPLWLSVASYVAPTGWTLTVTDEGADDVSDEPTGAELLTPGGATLTRALEVPGDVDVFRVPVVTGEIVSITSSATLTIRTPTGARLNATSFRAALTGDYFVEVTGSVGAYTLSAALGSDDFGNTIATASPLASGTLQSGRIDYPGDVDFFSVNATAGQLVIAEAGECLVRILSSTGGTLASAYDGTTWLPAGTGTHYVVVGSCAEPDYALLVSY